jgi:phosphoglycerate dehydrogenase-like enzyme
LRWVHNLPAGVEGTLTPAVRAAGRVVFTASEGPIGPMMAEHALLVLLALACDLPGFLRDQAARRWRFLADERPTVDVFGKTVLILGVGVVGGHLARMCRVGLGMCVLGLARGPSCPPRSARPTSSRCASPWPPRRRGSSTRRRWRRCARTPP